MTPSCLGKEGTREWGSLLIPGWDRNTLLSSQSWSMTIRAFWKLPGEAGMPCDLKLKPRNFFPTPIFSGVPLERRVSLAGRCSGTRTYMAWVGWFPKGSRERREGVWFNSFSLANWACPSWAMNPHGMCVPMPESGMECPGQAALPRKEACFSCDFGG